MTDDEKGVVRRYIAAAEAYQLAPTLGNSVNITKARRDLEEVLEDRPAPASSNV